MSLKVYGIASCETCRRARAWLRREGIEACWVDWRKQPPDRHQVQSWLAQIGPATVLNRRSATWRALPGDQRPALQDPTLVEWLIDYPTLIKRPLFERDGSFKVGFDHAVQTWLRQ